MTSNEPNRPQEPMEQQAVRTTIVGGRPPGCGKGVGAIPRGIEVLIKKAAVDADFRRLLIDQRAAAADEIGLLLKPAEAVMLAAIPAATLEMIIAATYVEPAKIPTFLGRVAAAMLLALGAGAAMSSAQVVPVAKGVRPPESNAVVSTAPATAPANDGLDAHLTKGIRPDGPTSLPAGATSKPAAATKPATAPADANAALQRPKEVGAVRGVRVDTARPQPAAPASLSAADAERLNKFVADFDSDDAQLRSAAHKGILDMGLSVLPHLQKLRQGKLSPEASVRIDAIIEQLYRSGAADVENARRIDLERQAKLAAQMAAQKAAAEEAKKSAVAAATTKPADANSPATTKPATAPAS